MVRKRPEIKYISKVITYPLLRDIILDENLAENDTLILNSKNFDNVLIEYSETNRQSMTFPHFILGVSIREDYGERISLNQIGILRDDSESIRIFELNKFEYDSREIVYRCRWCGTFVNEKGNELEGYILERAKNSLKHFKASKIKHTNGKCCSNESD